MTIGRRAFLGTAAAAPLVAGIPNLTAVKTRRAAKWEIAYKAPHSHPNGLCLTNEGMWVQDQGPESWMSLINPATRKA